MNSAISIPIGVIVARERTANHWQEYRWRPVDVLLNAPDSAIWREVRRGKDFVHYHAATLPLVLKASEKVGYRINLANGVPSVYVVLSEHLNGNGSRAMPVTVTHLTVSPFEIQSFGSAGHESVERVPMPEPLVQLLHSFVDDNLSVNGSARAQAWPAALTQLKFGV
jgi:hypothetical protein